MCECVCVCVCECVCVYVSETILVQKLSWAQLDHGDPYNWRGGCMLKCMHNAHGVKVHHILWHWGS